MSRLFSRVSNPDRFFRFRKTAFALTVLSWAPFLMGGYLAYDTTRREPPKGTTQKQFIEASGKARNYAASALLIGGSYVVGWGAGAYYVAARVHRYRRGGPAQTPS